MFLEVIPMANERFPGRKHKKPRQEWNPHWLLKLLYMAGSVALSLLKIAIGAAATVVLIVLISGTVFVGTLGDYLQEDILTEAGDWSLEDYVSEKTSFMHYVDSNGDIQLLQQIFTTTDRQWVSIDEILFNMLQQTLLLFFIEGLNLVQVQQHPVGGHEGIQLGNDLLNIRRRRSGGIELIQHPVGLLGDNVGNGGLTGTAGTVEDHIGNIAGINQTAQNRTLPQNMLLSIDLIQGGRPQQIGQRLVHTHLLVTLSTQEQKTAARW